MPDSKSSGTKPFEPRASFVCRQSLHFLGVLESIESALSGKNLCDLKLLRLTVTWLGTPFVRKAFFALSDHIPTAKRIMSI